MRNAFDWLDLHHAVQLCFRSALLRGRARCRGPNVLLLSSLQRPHPLHVAAHCSVPRSRCGTRAVATHRVVGFRHRDSGRDASRHSLQPLGCQRAPARPTDSRPRTFALEPSSEIPHIFLHYACGAILHSLFGRRREPLSGLRHRVAALVGPCIPVVGSSLQTGVSRYQLTPGLRRRIPLALLRHAPLCSPPLPVTRSASHQDTFRDDAPRRRFRYPEHRPPTGPNQRTRRRVNSSPRRGLQMRRFCHRRSTLTCVSHSAFRALDRFHTRFCRVSTQPHATYRLLSNQIDPRAHQRNVRDLSFCTGQRIRQAILCA